MKKMMNVRSKSAVAGFALVLASAMPGSAAVLHVPSATYPTIQAAVNGAAAAGDEIQISPGVYTNQVVIVNKNLTLSGSPGAILRATPNMQQTLLSVANADGDAVLGIFESTNVVVSGLTFEGERLGNDYTNGLVGIWFLASSGFVADCRFMGFRGSTLATFGAGVDAMNPHGFGVGPVNFQALRNTFADNERSIVVSGDVPWGNQPWQPERLSTTFAMDDNTIIGNGPDPTGWQFGIWINPGAGGEVERNIVTGHDHLGPPPPPTGPHSVGIAAADGVDIGTANELQAIQPIHFEGNILTSNQVDLGLLNADGSTVVNNSFEGTAQGYRPGGLYFSGNDVTVASNRFSNMPMGILVVGNDPEVGTAFGIASNATLIANGFCNVATNYVFDPQATYDLQSTLDCPSPPLNITRAVLLSWPYDIQGYSLQTAPTVDGPWTNSDATLFLQNGQNSAALPADRAQQFFRLVTP